MTTTAQTVRYLRVFWGSFGVLAIILTLLFPFVAERMDIERLSYSIAGMNYEIIRATSEREKLLTSMLARADANYKALKERCGKSCN